VTSIGDHAFNCCGLTIITIPDNVTSIGAMAFNGCQELANIVFKGNAPKVSSQTFSGVTSSCTVLVSPSSTGWDVEIPGTWNGMRIEYYVFQPLADVATAAEVVEALSVTDGNLATNITNVRSVRGHSP
jgi:hypothetical protein